MRLSKNNNKAWCLCALDGGARAELSGGRTGAVADASCAGDGGAATRPTLQGMLLQQSLVH